MALQTVKTTIQIDPQLLYQAKLRALQEGKSLKQLIEDSLKTSLQIKSADRKAALKKLARETIGSLKLSRHPEWKDLESIIKWQKDLRAEWD